MSTYKLFDEIAVTIEGCEPVWLPAVPILPGGMVDIALNELGAVIVDVCPIEEETPLVPADTT
jgi:hypothetical protein